MVVVVVVVVVGNSTVDPSIPQVLETEVEEGVVREDIPEEVADHLV